MCESTAASVSPLLATLLGMAKSPDLNLDDATTDVVSLLIQTLESTTNQPVLLHEAVARVVGAYLEALNTPSLGLTATAGALASVLVAPLSGPFQVERFGYSHCSRYSVPQFYNAVLKEVLRDLRTAKVSWL